MTSQGDGADRLVGYPLRWPSWMAERVAEAAAARAVSVAAFVRQAVLHELEGGHPVMVRTVIELDGRAIHESVQPGVPQRHEPEGPAVAEHERPVAEPEEPPERPRKSARAAGVAGPRTAPVRQPRQSESAADIAAFFGGRSKP